MAVYLPVNTATTPTAVLTRHLSDSTSDCSALFPFTLLSELECDVCPGPIMLQAYEVVATDGSSQRGGEAKEEEENEPTKRHNYGLELHALRHQSRVFFSSLQGCTVLYHQVCCFDLEG